MDLLEVIVIKGIFVNWICIFWEYGGDIVEIDNFLVYWDDEWIVILGVDDCFYNDSDGVFGWEYVYIVFVVVNGDEDFGLLDIGFIRGNGQLEGEVLIF